MEEVAAVVIAATAVLALTLAGWQVYEARQMRGEEFRPWVTVSFHFRSNIAFVAIRNVGRTVAREVEITFDPPLTSTLALAQKPVAMLAEPLPQLAPGEDRLLLLDRVPDRLESDLPKQHEVRARYRDHRRKPLPEDRFVLDFALLSGARLPDKGMHDLVEAVAKLPKAMTTPSHGGSRPADPARSRWDRFRATLRRRVRRG